jgi:CheY-like chemotaxis protein
VGLVLRDTLKVLLSSCEEKTVALISSDNREVMTLAMDAAGQNKYASAARALLERAGIAIAREEYGVLFVAISALSRIQPPEALDLFRQCVRNEDPIISSQCIEILGDLQDIASLDTLCAIVTASDTEDTGGECDLSAANAITALGKIGGKESVSFLVSKLHHNSPAARRLIHETLARLGGKAVDALAAVFKSMDVDNRIFAANILGNIGSRDAADALVGALDKGRAEHPNIRFAIYEALGKTSGMTGLVCLADGLKETDQMVLMAVIASLDMHLNDWIRDKIAESVRQGSEHGKILAKAIVASQSPNIFAALFTLDEAIGKLLAEEVGLSGDSELVSQFCEKLREIGTGAALSTAQDLEKKAAKSAGPQILAVDDSKAMLNFYRSIASSMGLNIVTAMNGKEGLNALYGGEPFRLVITDMNMPVMDGIEFTRSMKEDPSYAELPVIMITTESERSQQAIAKEAGVTRFLQKPFSVDALQELISSYL